MSGIQDTDVLSGRYGRFAAAFVALVVLDQLTKQWALSALADGPIDVFWTLRWRLIFNPGASFSTGTSLGPWFGALAFVMVGVLAWMVRDTDETGAWLFGAVAGGAVGNLIDRLFRSDDGFLGGEVVDFIDFGWWPVFNIADVGIVGGVLLVAVRSLWHQGLGGRGSATHTATVSDSAAAPGVDAAETVDP